jgi:hypothetical protein
MVDHGAFGRTSDSADDAVAALQVIFSIADDMWARFERIERLRPWGGVGTACGVGTLPDGDALRRW